MMISKRYSYSASDSSKAAFIHTHMAISSLIHISKKFTGTVKIRIKVNKIFK